MVWCLLKLGNSRSNTHSNVLNHLLDLCGCRHVQVLVSYFNYYTTNESWVGLYRERGGGREGGREGGTEGGREGGREREGKGGREGE